MCHPIPVSIHIKYPDSSAMDHIHSLSLSYQMENYSWPSQCLILGDILVRDPVTYPVVYADLPV